MSVRVARGVLTPSQGYVCLSCRLQNPGVERGRTRGYRYSAPGDNNEAPKAPGELSTETGKDEYSATRRAFRDMIRGFVFGNDPVESKTKGIQHETTQEPKAEPKGVENPSAPRSKSPTPSTDLAQQKLQRIFAAQRREQMLAMQTSKAFNAGGHQDEPKESKGSRKQPVAAPQRAKPRTKVGKRYDSVAGCLGGELRRLSVARRNAEPKVPKSKKNKSTAKSARPKDLRKEMAEEADTRSVVIKPIEEPTVETLGDNVIEVLKPNPQNSPPQPKGAKQGSMKARITSQKTVERRSKAQDDDQQKGLAEAEQKSGLRLTQSLFRKAVVRRTSSRLDQANLSTPIKKQLSTPIKKQLSTPIKKRLSTPIKEHPSTPTKKHQSTPTKKPLLGPDQRFRLIDPLKGKSTTIMSEVFGLDSLRTALKGNRKVSETDIEKADASKLEILPIEIDQAPVPRLSYGLERVLFNPGVYQLQDPRSRVYNFDPYLQTIMPVADFDFNALKEYITSSKDESLKRIAKMHGKRYVGSTSSMTAALAHFHFLLSQWRPINTSMLSKSFPATLTSFTQLQRAPSAIFLKWKDGAYAIDADKQFDTANVLSMLGKSMEKLLTLNTEDYERYRKTSPHQVTNEEQLEPETFHYSTMGDFLMRSQLDAHDARLPGTGMFDLKTRAVVSIRMDVERYEHGLGYQIKSRLGEWESYEREYYDMIRAAFLKYSMQVRMGRMDGIFVAFHNVDRIFGFQYISLPEMDSTIHGQWDTSIGDQEFKLSLDLLNKILNKATKNFPETSIRLHFETREAATPFMYIFAEPVTEEQVAEIQSQNEARVEAFNRNILGLHRGEDIESQEDEEEDDSRWENIQADVQEAMEKDEFSVNDPSKEQDVEDDEFEESELTSDEKGAINQGALYTNKSNAHSDEDVFPTAAGSEGDKDGIDVVEDDEEVEEQGQKQDDEIDQAQSEEEESNEVSEEIERSAENEELVENVEEDSDTEESLGEHKSVNPSEDEGQSSEQSATATSENMNEAEDDTQAASDAEAGRQYVPSMLGAEEEEFPTEADQPFIDSINEELAEADEAASSGQNILAMTLTVRNKVNGKFVLRPDHFTAEDSWSIEYSLTKIASQRRARTLYEACQARRKKHLDTPEAPEEGEALSSYLRNLRELSAKGKKWRNRMDKENSKKPTQVLGTEILQSSGKDNLANQDAEG